MFLEAKEKAGRLRVDVMVEVSIRPIGQGLQEDSQNWIQSILWGFWERQFCLSELERQRGSTYILVYATKFLVVFHIHRKKKIHEDI